MILNGFVRLTLITIVLFAVGCEKYKHEVLKLPPATQTGENTLGFLIDNQVWIANGGGYYPSFFSKNFNSQKKSFDLTTNNRKDFECPSKFSIIILNFEGTGKYNFEDIYSTSNATIFSGCSESFKYGESKLDTNGLNNITITNFSLTERIVSGTFNLTLINLANNEPILIRNGRFDVGEIGIY